MEPASGARPAGITFVGRGFVPGNAADNSDLAGSIGQLGNTANCIPKSTFGGFDSAMTYTGFDNVFLAVPDRGPFDGRTGIRTRRQRGALFASPE